MFLLDFKNEVQKYILVKNNRFTTHTIKTTMHHAANIERYAGTDCQISTC
jgi:hypothetical protein